jgi:outer membrane receptor protein involved in Fe transport
MKRKIMQLIFKHLGLIGAFLMVWVMTPALAVETVPGSGTGRIIGTVLDSASQAPVEFATVALLDPATGKPVDGTVCNDKGEFEISKVPEGNYQVSISFMGYETATIARVEVDRRQDAVQLGRVILRPSVRMLGEVTVQGQRSLIEERVDRTVYNAEFDATAQGGDATDVLRRVPMLSVDLDGNVSLRGNQNVTVLLNNKPSSIMAASLADALRQIPAEQIKSVEVITSPSARYDAEGSGGIINIITKKNTLQGLSLGINSGVGLRGSNLGLNGGYRKGKIGINLGGFGRAGYNMPGKFENNQLTRDNSGDSFLAIQKADTRNNMMFGNYTFGLDYDIDESNYIISSVRFGLRNRNSYQDGLLSQTFSNDVLRESSLRNVNVSDLSGTVDFNLNYTHLFKKPQQEFSLLGLVSRTNATNDFYNDLLDLGDETLTGRLLNENNSFNEEIALQADFQTPIWTKHILEVGAKEIFRTVNSAFAYYQSEGPDGELVPIENPLLSNDFNYYQSVSAGYFSLTMALPGAITLKGGARYEYTRIEADFQGQEEIDIPSYGVLVPSLNLSRKLNNSGTVKAAYNRRIQRPSLRFLNPNVQASNPLDISVGNPLLDPEFTDNYELSYSTFGKGINLNVTGFIRSTNNAIQNVRQVLGQDTLLTTYENIGRENAYGVSVFGGVMALKKLSLNGGIDVYYAVLDNNSPMPEFDARNSGWVPSYRLMGNYDLSKGWGLQFFGFYRGRNVQLQGYRGGFGIYSLALQKSFAEKRGSVGLGLENFFTPTFVIRSESQSPTFVQRNVDTREMFSLRLNFNYRIGKMSADTNPRKKRKTINLDDMKGGDGGEQMDASPGGGGNSSNGMQRNGGNSSRPGTSARPGNPAGSPAATGGTAQPGKSPEAAAGGGSPEWQRSGQTAPAGSKTEPAKTSQEGGEKVKSRKKKSGNSGE